MIIREAVPADCEQIAATHIRSWQAGYVGMLPASYLAGFDLGVWADRHRRTLAELRPPAAVFVAEIDGSARAGAAADSVSGLEPRPGTELRPSTELRPGTEARPGAEARTTAEQAIIAGHAWVRDGEIRTLYVDPDHWSGGVGSALLEAAVGHLRAHGGTPVHLWVIAANERARRFYERFGFVADGASRRQPLGAGYESVPPIEHVRYTLTPTT